MDRKEAIRIIAEKEYGTLTRGDRELLVNCSWGLDESDKEFHLVSKELQEELLKFNEPQGDVMSSRYDMLVKMACEKNCKGWLNDELAAKVSKIVEKPITVKGKNPKRYPCPCCGEKTLSMRAEYDICSNCGWEDAGCWRDEDYSSPNHMTLGEGRKNYRLYGRCDAPKSTK